ncbi:MAG: RNA polymerase sigma factor [Dethiobacteria bacterium]|nr:RNA polymerase sigma factor [Bacillota bacterium]
MEPDRILQLIRQNDNDSRRELFEAFYRRTYAVVFSILRHRESAEDITQDAFIKAFQSLHQLNDGAKFGAWLAVIASNLARNYLKREKRIILTDELPVIETGISGDDTEQEALRSMEVDRVRNAVRELPPDQYQVIVLQYYHDLKVEEIADMLKISPGTVKSRLFRARQRLAGFLELDDDSGCLNTKGGDRERCQNSQLEN